MEIGSRPSGSEVEASAADYIGDQLAGYGYEVNTPSFTYDYLSDAEAGVEILSPEARRLEGSSLQPVGDLPVPAGPEIEGILIATGLGREQDFPPGSAGKVVLIERGELTFGEKVSNAAAAGATAAIIYNNEPGAFTGLSAQPFHIITVTISQEEGLALLDLLAQDAVRVRVVSELVREEADSQNVVARPPAGDCRVIVGGHYDSVAAGPGANDNASGTATVLEMARVLAADGEFDDVCFVLFGAEEAGLIGSREFVDSLSADERQGIEGMLNFDMVGVGTSWLLAGSLELRDLATVEADRLGLVYEVSDGPPAGLGSDHSSFIQRGIPAIFFHRLGDPHYHTAEDQAEFVQEERLAQVGEVGMSVIEALLGGR